MQTKTKIALASAALLLAASALRRDGQDSHPAVFSADDPNFDRNLRDRRAALKAADRVRDYQRRLGRGNESPCARDERLKRERARTGRAGRANCGCGGRS